MRTHELTARVDAISRGDGRSATAAAAYRACCIIECEREGRTHDYTRKRGLEVTAVVLPAGAPEWALDRARLWNAAELREKNGKRGANAGGFKANAQVAREVMFTFPAELSAEGRLATAQRIALHLATKHIVAADFSIHQPGSEGDERNFHCHLMMTTRRLGPKGLGDKVREWSGLHEGKDQTRELRAFIAAVMNDQLRQEGKADLVHVEHRSFSARGSGQVATIHQGPAKTNLIRKRQGQARRAWEAEQKAAQTNRHVQEIESLKLKQDSRLQTKSGELTERWRNGEAAIRRELDAQRQADPARQKTGILSVLRTLTGQAKHDALNREIREADRVMTARQKVEKLNAEIKQERATFMATQAKERADLINRHRQEDGQMRTAFAHRYQLDHAAEALARMADVDRKHERDLEHSGARSIGGRSQW
jgi:hypothetical protein